MAEPKKASKAKKPGVAAQLAALEDRLARCEVAFERLDELIAELRDTLPESAADEAARLAEAVRDIRHG